MTSETYIKQIVRHLKCSKSKRQEVSQQLEEKISRELAEGKSLALVMQQMGTPAGAAEDYNLNFPEQEYKRYRRRIAGIAMSVIAIIVVIVFAIGSYVMPKTSAFTEDGVYQASVLEQDAQKIAELMGEQDFDTILEDYSAQTLQAALSAKDLESAYTGIADDWGDLEHMGTAYLTEVTQRGETYAVVQVSAAYAHASVIYTMSFNEDEVLVGFYLK